SPRPSTPFPYTTLFRSAFAGFPRSYPDGMEDDDVDALAYAPSGFIWDNALEHGKSVRDYGEFAISDIGWKDRTRKPAPKFLDFRSEEHTSELQSPDHLV